VTYSIDDSNNVKYVSYIWDGSTPNTGVDQLNKSDVRYYPNPVTDLLEINFNNRDKRPLSILLKDISGKTIKEIELPGDNIEQYRIDMKGLNKGMYFISINNEENEMGSWKVIKN
jgi:hypothetical protein